MSDAALRLAFTAMHPERLHDLETRFGTPERAMRALLSTPDVPETTKSRLAVDGDQRRAELTALGIEALHRDGSRYPQRLGRWPDAPPVLFSRGEVPEGRSIAVVGTRRCTAYGKEVAASYGRAVARAGWILVSGLARGIDGAAHRGTVAAGGRGIAVLGSGLDAVYPAEHRDLADALCSLGGAIVSEYPPATTPEGWRFPPRNRIIAGLADAVVVVEAGDTGGALITAARATEYGIPVFAVPGDVDRDTSRGTNRLIRDGAHPVLDADDLLEELSLVVDR